MVPYMKQAWPGVSVTPSGPVPTVTYFVLGARQPINDFCRYIKTLQRLDTLGDVMASGKYFNELTNNQFSEHVNFLQETYAMGDKVANYLNKEPDRRNSMMMHRRINRYLKVQDEYFTGEGEDRTFESRGARKQKMSRMIRSANKVAMLNNLIRCPDGEREVDEKEKEYYENEIFPLYELVDESSDEAAYYMARLQYMGKKIMNSYSDFRKYQADLYQLYHTGVSLRRSRPKFKSEQTFKAGEKKTIKKRYYEYRPASRNVLFKNFMKKYLKEWSDYVQYRIVSQPRGILADPKSSINQEFRNLAHECRRSKIEWQIRRSSPRLRYLEEGNAEFKTKVDKRIKDCRKGINPNGKKISNLMTLFIGELRKHLAALKGRQATIYSYESEKMGQHRKVRNEMVSTDIGDVTREEISCERKLNEGEATRVKGELQEAATQSRMMIAEEMATKTALERQRMEREKRKNEKIRRSREIRKVQESRRRPTPEIGIPDSNTGF